MRKSPDIPHSPEGTILGQGASSLSELCQLCGIPFTVNLAIPAIDKLSRQNKWDVALSVGVKQETDAEYPYSVESNIFNGNGEKLCQHREYPVIN